MKRLISAILAISITASVAKPVKANPAALVAPAACATGVGCIVVGVGLIGTAVVYYIWATNDGKRIKTTPSGDVFRSDYLEDPEESVEEWSIYRARDKKHCRSLAGGREYKWENNSCFIKG